MNIVDVHQYLAATFFPGIAITDPEIASIQKAYPMTPDLDAALTDIPCVIMPGFELQAVMFHSAFIEERYAVRAQVFVKRAEVQQSIGAQMAASFLTAIGLALSSHQRLGQTASLVRGLRGERDTLVSLTWAGVSYIGLDLWIDITLKTSKEHAA